jgi:hypothetical protein
MEQQTQTVRTIDLGYEQVLMLDSGPGTRVRVLYGAMWLTEEGLGADRFARAGDDLALRTRGRAVIEGLSPGRVQVFSPADRQAGRGAPLARRAARLAARAAAWMRRWRTRMQLGRTPACCEDGATG